MSEPLKFDLRRSVRPGVVEEIAPLVRRVAAANQTPYTFTGTNTYIVGEGTVAVIDPGPADEAHLERLVSALAGRTVSHILVTHTHRDHSPLAGPLARETGAPVLAFGRHAPARPELAASGTEAGGDTAFAPDAELGHGDTVSGPGWTLEALHTPGHTTNHLCFALQGTGALFSGDHVMGWSTTMVAPPDGDMASYLASLAQLGARDDRIYWPGHGGAIEIPRRYVRALAQHRETREAAILTRLRGGPADAATIAGEVYSGLAAELMRPAMLTTLAHLIHLVEQGHASAEGALSFATVFRAAG